MHPGFGWALGALLLSACSGDRLGGECASDRDCPMERPACLLDLKKVDGEDVPFTYCTETCLSDRACPPARRCRSGDLDDGVTERYCVDRVRVCGDADPLNGLDDDCDGQTDPPGAPSVTRCNDDEVCGAFVCTAPTSPEDQGAPATTVCAAPQDGASVENFLFCEDGSACRNGLCIGGVCAPICRGTPEGSAACRVVIEANGRERPTVCARGFDGRPRPDFNVCQLDCQERGCPEGTSCVWRDVVGPVGGLHHFVCARVDPAAGLTPLGGFCPRNDVESDLGCARGLCFGQTCTRKCDGPGADCSDVGADFICEEVVLFYGDGEVQRSFPNFVCTRREG